MRKMQWSLVYSITYGRKCKYPIYLFKKTCWEKTYFFVQSLMFWAPLNLRSILALVGGSGGQFPLISSVKPPQKSTASCNCDEKLSWAKLLEIKLRIRNSVACIFSSFFCLTELKPMTTSNFISQVEINRVLHIDALSIKVDKKPFVK